MFGINSDPFSYNAFSFQERRRMANDFWSASLITDDLALLELRRMVGEMERKRAFPDLGEIDLPAEGRHLSLDDFCSRHLAPLAVDIFLKRNRGLDHPEWV